VPFVLDGNRLLVRVPSGVASRIWENSRVQLTPYASRWRRLKPALEAVGRVLADEEECAAESALAARDGLLQRLRLRLMRRLGVELLYVEVTPAAPSARARRADGARPAGPGRILLQIPNMS
jgi:hypothetical protein